MPAASVKRKNTHLSPKTGCPEHRNRSEIQFRESDTDRVWARSSILIVSICLPFLLYLFTNWNALDKQFKFRISGLKQAAVFCDSSDDEDFISTLRFSRDDSVQRAPFEPERMLSCVPTVARPNNIEYASNTVKSWRVATMNNSYMGRMIVFEMDVDERSRDTHQKLWLSRVFNADPFSSNSSWLEVRHRRSDFIRAPRKRTHGDSVERVSWRSKEALDYAEVLERCASLTDGDYIAIFQDDVLFAPHVDKLLDQLDAVMLTPSTAAAENQLRSSHAGNDGIWCGASLFDVNEQENEVAKSSSSSFYFFPQRSSNMVARVYSLRDGGKFVSRLVKFIRRRFDESPVDWLVDQFCAHQGYTTYVLRPLAVRHRGAVSSLKGNKREGLLT